MELGHHGLGSGPVEAGLGRQLSVEDGLPQGGRGRVQILEQARDGGILLALFSGLGPAPDLFVTQPFPLSGVVEDVRLASLQLVGPAPRQFLEFDSVALGEQEPIEGQHVEEIGKLLGRGLVVAAGRGLDVLEDFVGQITRGRGQVLPLVPSTALRPPKPAEDL